MVKITVILFTLFSSNLFANFEVRLEAGLAWQQRNDIQRPPNSGTLFALDEVDKGPFPAYRVELFYRNQSPHAFRLMLAPFKVNFSGSSAQSINFNNTSFAANTPTEFEYQFNSYRFTYFYTFRGHGEEQLNLGFTAKVRDADVRISQASVATNYDNVGFVPLLYFEYQTALTSNWLFNFNMDGLAGGPGRAFDLAFKFRRRIGKNHVLGVGKRILEGGADSDEVYSFSFINYLVFDYSYQF